MKYVTPENGAPERGPETPANGPSEHPDWVVGQRVSGEDYGRLPLGSVVTALGAPCRTKVADNQWRTDHYGWQPVLTDDQLSEPRTLKRLGYGAPEEETFYRDKETGEPCPRRGNVLCTLPYDPAHRHEHVTEGGRV